MLIFFFFASGIVFKLGLLSQSLQVGLTSASFS